MGLAVFNSLGARQLHNLLFCVSLCSTPIHWKLIHSIKTMNWTKIGSCPSLLHEQIVILTTPGRMITHIRPSSLENSDRVSPLTPAFVRH